MASNQVFDLKIRHEPSGTTRKVVLPLSTPPNWDALADAAVRRFDLPGGVRVGMRYVDQDGDLVTVCVAIVSQSRLFRGGADSSPRSRSSQVELDELWEDILKGRKDKEKAGETRTYVRVNLVDLTTTSSPPSSAAVTAIQVPAEAGPTETAPTPAQPKDEDEDDEWVKADSDLVHEKKSDESSGYDDPVLPSPVEARRGYDVGYDSPLEPEKEHKDEADKGGIEPSSSPKHDKGKERVIVVDVPHPGPSGVVDIPVTIRNGEHVSVDQPVGRPELAAQREKTAFENSISDEEERQLAEAIRLSRIEAGEDAEQPASGPSVDLHGATASRPETAQETVNVDHSPTDQTDAAPLPELPAEDPPETAAGTGPLPRGQAERWPPRPRLSAFLGGTLLEPFAVRLESAFDRAPPELNRALDDLWSAAVDVGHAGARMGTAGAEAFRGSRDSLDEATRGFRGFAAGTRFAGGPDVAPEARGWRGGVHRFGGRGRGAHAGRRFGEPPITEPPPQEQEKQATEPEQPAPANPCGSFFGPSSCGGGGWRNRQRWHDDSRSPGFSFFGPCTFPGQGQTLSGNGEGQARDEVPIDLQCFGLAGQRSIHCQANHPSHSMLDDDAGLTSDVRARREARRERRNERNQDRIHRFHRHRSHRHHRHGHAHAHGHRDEAPVTGEESESSDTAAHRDQPEQPYAEFGRREQTVPGAFDRGYSTEEPTGFGSRFEDARRRGLTTLEDPTGEFPAQQPYRNDFEMPATSTFEPPTHAYDVPGSFGVTAPNSVPFGHPVVAEDPAEMAQTFPSASPTGYHLSGLPGTMGRPWGVPPPGISSSPGFVRFGSDLPAQIPGSLSSAGQPVAAPDHRGLDEELDRIRRLRTELEDEHAAIRLEQTNMRDEHEAIRRENDALRAQMEELLGRARSGGRRGWSFA